MLGERVKLKHKITLGENCFVNDDVCMGGIVTIGKGCRIETKAVINSCNTHGNSSLFNSDTILFPSDNCVQGEKDVPVKIGDYVVIGNHCFVTKGVTVGDKAVLRAGSVVYGNVPAFAIVMGNPAKIVGYRNQRE